MSNILVIDAHNDAYSTNDVQNTMTLDEFIEYLEYMRDCQLDGDSKVMLSFDRGYTFGAIRARRIKVEEEEVEEEEEEEEEEEA